MARQAHRTRLGAQLVSAVYAPKARDARAPITAHQALEPDRAALAGCMHKTVLANVDANVGILLAGGVEEDQVTR